MRPLAIALLATILGSVPAAAAPDPPEWVAALYVDARRAVGLRWMPVGGATEYKVLRSETAGSGYAEIAITTQPQHFDTAVEAGTSYYYVLQAVAGAEVGPNSAEKTVRIPGQKKVEIKPPEFTKVLPRSSTEFGKTAYKVGLFWNPVQAAIAYNLYRSTESGKGYELILSGSETQAVDSTVDPEKTYYYVVTALDREFVETGFSAEERFHVKKRKPKKRKRRVKLRVMPRSTTLLWALRDHAWSDDEGDRTAPLGDVANAAFEEATGHLYLTSTLNRNIVVIDGRDGSLVRTLGPELEGYSLGVPLGIDVDNKGRLAVVDGKTQKVIVLTREGTLIRIIDPEPWPEEKGPLLMDAAFLPDGSLSVTDNANGNVIVFDEEGREAGRWSAGAGREADPELSPIPGITMIATTPAGRLAVLDGLAGRVRIFTPAGEFHATFGERKPTVAGLIFPTSIVALRGGTFLLGDNEEIREFGPQKDPRWYVAHLAGERGNRDRDRRGTVALAGDGAYTLFVVDRWGNRISAYRLGPEVKERQGGAP